MRRLVLALILVLAPGLGWSAGGRMTVVAPPALRGSQPVKAPVLASAAPAKAPAPALPPLTDPAADCRLSCAQARYFCEASSNSDSCGTNWGQCTAACAAPNLAPPAIGGGAGN